MLSPRFTFVSCLLASVSVSAYQCSDFIVPVGVDATTLVPAFPPFKDHYQSVAFLLQLTSRTSADGPSPFAGTKNISETFDISARYCWSSKGQHHGKDVQVLSHGIGFDKAYWDVGGPSSEYNYIRAATDAGYSTLSYDRLGVGLSSAPDPYTTVQGPVQLAILTTLTTRLRNGNLHSSIPKAAGKVVHVGHSYGSILTNALVAEHPTLSDGIVLTGYNIDVIGEGLWLSNSGFHLARENQPARFANRSTGYLIWGDEEDNQYGFLNYPNFSPLVLAEAEATKYPLALGELLTGPPAIPVNATAFTGPVLLLTGDRDLIFCASNCTGVLEASKVLFPKAKTFETYLQPNTGHGVNLHYNASGAYGVIERFFAANV